MNVAAGPPEAPETLRRRRWVVAGAAVLVLAGILLACWVELIMLIVFLIPGTPKDFLTYFAGLTRMRYLPVLAITTLGRIPSIATSTMAASALGDGNYLLAIGAVVVAGLLIAVGGVAYRRLEARERDRA